MIRYHQLTVADDALISQLAKWYQQEWRLPPEKTIDHLTAIAGSADEFQLVLFVDDVPVATGGVYRHVGLLDREPRLHIYPYWLALVFTLPACRGQGYGSLLCRAIAAKAAAMQLPALHLFTDSAEELYLRLGWEVIEKLTAGGRQLSIMRLK